MSEPTEKMASTNKSIEKDGDDVAVLIYRESQLRKAEAAVAASERKMTSSAASTHNRMSSRKKIQVVNQDDTSTIKSHKASKRKRLSLSEAKEGPIRKKVDRRKYKKICSADGCTNQVVNGGVCIKHGAKVKRCSKEGCTNYAINGGVCRRHGAKLKRCSKEGCAKE